MFKLAVLAVCLLFASTVLTGASSHRRKSSSSPSPASKKSASAKHSKLGSARTSSRTRGSSHRKSTASAGGAAKGKRSARNSRGKGKGTRTAASRANAQRVPTPDRYREIQQALADRGYYKGPVNGEWGSESADSLKRFQQDQKLSPNGKLDSLSLISLGLGPKRDPNALGGPATTSTSNSSSTTTSPKEPLQP